ncbi:MAG: hypothetical protein L0H73_00005 [Nitrococcus sp.]|nr:hypothetical protein [Nitrococcus sp.]
MTGSDATPLADDTFGAYGTPDYLQRIERWRDARLIETAWQERGLEELSWEAWLCAAGLHIDMLPSPLRFDQEHYVVQAGLASQALVLTSSLLVSDFVQRGWLEAYRPEVQMAGRRYTALCLPGSASLRKVSYFLEWLQKEAMGDA